MDNQQASDAFAGGFVGFILGFVLCLCMDSCVDRNQKRLDQQEAVKEGHAHYEATPEGSAVFKWNVQCSK